MNSTSEILQGYKWIKVKAHIDDPSKTWQERYHILEQHHRRETEFLIAKVRELAKRPCPKCENGANMDPSKSAWSLLAESTGSYAGQGINHERQDFTGEFSLAHVMTDKLITVSSKATGKDGEVYHHEVSWIGYDMSGALTLFVSSNNHPTITPHLFHRVEEKADAKNVVFRFGDPADRNSFREEITFSFYSDGQVAHHYAWGMPGGDFAPRSGAKMQPVSKT